MQFLLRLDSFRRIPAELTNPSFHGAYLTLIAYLIMGLLFSFELHSFLSTSITKSVELDSHYSNEIWIDFDVVMHQLPCKYTHVVIRDIVGHQELKVLESKITKERTDARTGAHKGIHDSSKDTKSMGFNADIRHIHNMEGEWSHPEFEEDWISRSSDHFKHTDFAAIIGYHDFSFINFYADWCIHCRRFAPIWIETETKADQTVFRDKSRNEVVAKLLRINCVEYSAICVKAGIRAYPTLRMYKRDKSFSVYHGKRKADEIFKFLTDFIKNQEITVAQRSAQVTHHSHIEEGCRVHGEIKVRRVPGYFLLEADSGKDSLEPAMTNVSHRVNHIWFLDDRTALSDYVRNTAKHVTVDVLRNVQPMKSMEFTTSKAHSAPQHYLNVIPTIFDNKVIVYQSTVQSHIADIETDAVPQARFSYVFSPMQIKISTDRRPFYDFLTAVFAIVGGTYTFVMLVDKFWDTMSIGYKRNIGKL